MDLILELDLTYIEEAIRKASDLFAEIALIFLKEVLKIFLVISRPLYLIFLSFGIIHYVISDSYKNKKYIYGAILLAIFSEVILPNLLIYLNISV